jgi:hypothetical protein
MEEFLGGFISKYIDNQIFAQSEYIDFLENRKWFFK